MGSQGGAQWQIGNEVEFKTAGGEEVSGQVYAFTPDSGMLLIKEPGAHNGVANLRWLKTSYVAEVLKNGAPAVPFDTQLPELDIAKCQKREAKALQQAEKEASRIGVGVSKTSQAIFEALSKTLPCHWKDKNIIVLEEVVISEPYTPSTCSSTANHQDTLARVKKVLAAERTRLGLSAE